MKRRPLPPWLSKPRSAYTYSANAVRSYDYWTAIYWATPPWLSKEQRAQMRELYKRRPEGYHVDHEVPLKGATVSGLNVPWNLRLVPAGANLAKAHHTWPDAPFETASMFTHEPHQLRMSL